jgi:membrane protein DedA with SNARE-associated domain
VFVGFVVPGETAAVLGGVAASRGSVSVGWMTVGVVLAAIVGDSVGYEVGRYAGPRMLRARMLDRHRDRIDGARTLLARRGSVAVFLGRSVAFFRAVMPALAGMAQMPYRRFLVANAGGGIVWGVATVLLGFLAGNSYERVEKAFGRGAAIAIAAVVLLALGAWLLRRRRSERH